jgi:predicted amidohydrolase
MPKLKIAMCQFGLREAKSHDEMAAHLKCLCETALAAGPDLILFPELTTIGLLSMAGPKLTYSELGKAFQEYISPFTPIYESLFSELARRSGATIVGGSHWVQNRRDEPGYNTAHMFFPSGRIERQQKNHLFPGETDWGTATHDGLHVFDTDSAKIGIMTCYDAEFPEVGRHFTLNGAGILLCPSATYTERGYYRIRRCCASRAVENQIVVVECHQVGSMTIPVDRPFTCYGRSAILCPIDEQTGVVDGVVVEADSGESEMVVFGEVDLDVLEKSRRCSEATILLDRRPETYQRHYRLV